MHIFYWLLDLAEWLILGALVGTLVSLLIFALARSHMILKRWWSNFQ